MNNTYSSMQDVRRVSNRLIKFFSVMSFKCQHIKIVTEEIKYNEYLNLLATFFGNTDLNEFQTNNEKMLININIVFPKLVHFISQQKTGFKFTKDDKEQLLNTLFVYFLLDEEEIKTQKKNKYSKIKARINKYLKESEKPDAPYLLEMEELNIFFKTIHSKEIQNVLYDYKSCSLFGKEFTYLLKEYYDYRNAFIIKKHVKFESIYDDFSRNIFQWPAYYNNIRKKSDYFRKTGTLPIETAFFMKEISRKHHMGMDMSGFSSLIIDFQKSVLGSLYKNPFIYKAVFNRVNKDGHLMNNHSAAYNMYGDIARLDLTLTNDFEFSIVIDDENISVAQFGDSNEPMVIVPLLENEINTEIKVAVPKVIRKNNVKEGYRFFYPKNDNDFFVLTLETELGNFNIVINRENICLGEECYSIESIEKYLLHI